MQATMLPIVIRFRSAINHSVLRPSELQIYSTGKCNREATETQNLISDI